MLRLIVGVADTTLKSLGHISKGLLPSTVLYGRSRGETETDTVHRDTASSVFAHGCPSHPTVQLYVCPFCLALLLLLLLTCTRLGGRWEFDWTNTPCRGCIRVLLRKGCLFSLVQARTANVQWASAFQPLCRWLVAPFFPLSLSLFPILALFDL